MPKTKVVIVGYDIFTAYGLGIDVCWRQLMARKTAIKKLTRFETKYFQSDYAATIETIRPGRDDSLIMQMLNPMLAKKKDIIPKDAFLFLATTIGEADILERHILENRMDFKDCQLDALLKKAQKIIGLTGPGMVISAACATSNTAVAQASGMIVSGQIDCALIIACDCVSETIFSGFSSLMAMDKDMARPFDINRNGLSIGEAAAYVLLMSERRALCEKRTVLGEMAGWGLASDAYHMTAPSPEGNGLALAINRALQCADISGDSIGCIAAHGTGTPYNDTMEMKTFKNVFGGHNNIPAYSVKGAIGHTMGASGLVEAIILLRALTEKTAPPTVNLRNIDNAARNWVSDKPQALSKIYGISASAGFGGVNAVLVIKNL